MSNTSGVSGSPIRVPSTTAILSSTTTTSTYSTMFPSTYMNTPPSPSPVAAIPLFMVLFS